MIFLAPGAPTRVTVYHRQDTGKGNVYKTTQPFAEPLPPVMLAGKPHTLNNTKYTCDHGKGPTVSVMLQQC